MPDFKKILDYHQLSMEILSISNSAVPRLDYFYSILKIIKETSKITINGYYQYANKNGKNHKSQQNRLFPKDGKINTLTTTSGGIKIIIDHETGKYRMLHPIEAERLQNVPVNYTLVDGVSKSDRFAMLGNGWTIDIISHIFNGMTFNKPSTNIKLKKIFKTIYFCIQPTTIVLANQFNLRIITH